MKRQDQFKHVADLYQAIKTNKQLALQNWQELGEVCYTLKETSKTTNEFGEQLTKHVPDLDVRLVSYAIKLAGHNIPVVTIDGKEVKSDYTADQIRKYLVETGNVSANPRLAWDRFWSVHRPDADEIKADKEAKKAAAKAARKEQGKRKMPYVKTLESIINNMTGDKEVTEVDALKIAELAGIVAALAKGIYRQEADKVEIGVELESMTG